MPHQRALAAIVAGRPGRRLVHVLRRRRRGRHREPGPHVHQAQGARASATRHGAAVRRGAARQARAGPRHPRLPAGAADDPAPRRLEQEPLPVHAAGHGPRRALRGRAEARGEAARAARASRTSRATCCCATRRSRVEIDRDRAAALGVSVDADRELALLRLRRAAGLDDLHADQPVPGHPAAAAASTSATRRRSTCSTCAPRRASWCRSASVASLRAEPRAADREPRRPAAGGDARRSTRSPASRSATP